MLRVVNFYLLIILQVVTSDPIPPQCTMPPAEVPNPEACCNLPQVYTEEDFKECNVDIPFDENKFKTVLPDCNQQKCLLKKYNLMKDDNDVDKDAVLKFMDKWVEANANFKDAIEKAKEICVKSEPGPPHICEPTDMFFCIGEVMFVECPKWEDTVECKIVQDHIEECKAYMP